MSYFRNVQKTIPDPSNIAVFYSRTPYCSQYSSLVDEIFQLLTKQMSSDLLPRHRWESTAEGRKLKCDTHTTGHSMPARPASTLVLSIVNQINEKSSSLFQIHIYARGILKMDILSRNKIICKFLA